MKESIHAVLTQARESLQQVQDEAFIIGSSALVLSGIEISKVNDIDLLVSTRDAEFLKKAWSDRIIKDYIPPQGDLFRSAFARFRFAGMDIEVMGDLEVHRNGMWTPVHIDRYRIMTIDELMVKIPTLEEQIRIFRMLGRDKDLQKVKLIEHSVLTDQSK